MKQRVSLRTSKPPYALLGYQIVNTVHLKFSLSICLSLTLFIKVYLLSNVYVPGNLQILLVISEQDTHNTSMVLRQPTNNFPYVLVHVNSEKRKYS